MYYWIVSHTYCITYNCYVQFFSWTINMQGAEGTLYDGEQFQLQFKFGSSYPFESPEVINLNIYLEQI